MTSIINTIEKLRSYIEKNRFKGYDPYDLLNSKLPIKELGHKITFLLTQIHKRNPVNLRPLFQIPKDYVPKGMGLFLKAYSILYRYQPSDDIKKSMEFLVNWILENSSSGYSGVCWGLNFPYSNRLSFVKEGSPSVVVTSFIHDGLFEYYSLTHDERALNALISSCEFIKNDLHWTKTDDGLCVSYTTKKRDVVLNANALGARMLAKTYSLTKEDKFRELAESMIRFTVNKMNADGSWPYRIFPNGRKKVQIDFHQGFIIDALHDYIQFVNSENDEIVVALKKGLEFYYHNQFRQNGQSYWRLPKKWPVDVHNQAQGIITFSKSYYLSDRYLPFAEKIAAWTIDNMQDEDGYFYYRKYPLVTDKTAYIRWAQAWMLLALVTLSNYSE